MLLFGIRIFKHLKSWLNHKQTETFQNRQSGLINLSYNNSYCFVFLTPVLIPYDPNLSHSFANSFLPAPPPLTLLLLFPVVLASQTVLINSRSLCLLSVCRQCSISLLCAGQQIESGMIPSALLANRDNLLWFGERCGFGSGACVAQSSKDKCGGLSSVMQ